MGKIELISKVAEKYRGELEMDSLIEAGKKGWRLAEEKFNSKDIKFETYALWWVRAAMIEKITGVSIDKIAKIEQLTEETYD